MAVKPVANISPRGINQKDLVNLIYQITASLKAICTKLDADGGVPLTTYLANCYTAIFHGQIRDCLGNSLQNSVTAKKPYRYFMISPYGVSDRAVGEWLYQVFDMLETLTEQCDTDTLQGSNYEALCYTAIMTQRIQDIEGNILGAGTEYLMSPKGVRSNKAKFVDLLYMILKAISTLTAKLDADTTVTDTNYTALKYTAIILTTVENSAGSKLGN